MLDPSIYVHEKFYELVIVILEDLFGTGIGDGACVRDGV
jgi:hypothetical protein